VSGHPDQTPSVPAVDAPTFAQVMACWPAGVAVVTTVDSDGTPRGLTTTAVTSVSLDPPLLLVCVDRTSRTLPALRHARAFAVNVLEAGQSRLARHFASKAEEKFAELAWRPGRDGMPILHDHCIAWAECRTRREIEAGDHLILVGEVVHGGAEEDRASLVYVRRGFGSVAALAPDPVHTADERPLS
jgi:flavin reductase (DIM6/NTAB) family NADH-FMN oxidoreductase RutF